MKTIRKFKITWIPSVFLLLSISLLFSLIFYVWLLHSWNTEQQTATRFFQQSFSSSIDQYEYLPALVAGNDRVHSALLETDRDQLDLNQRLKFIAQRAGADTVYVMNKQGKVIAASNFDLPNSFLHKNYSFRPYFSRAKYEKSRQFYYAIGATTGIPGFFISEPVIDEEGQVIGVVVVKLDLTRWEKNWQEAGQNVLVTDENNVVILSGQDEWRYRSIGVLSEQTLQKIRQQRQFRGIELSNLYQSIYEFARFDGFTISFWVIHKDAYLVNAFPIKGTEWTLYYLEKNERFIESALIFFLIFMGVLSLSLLYYRERQSRLRSRQHAREIEQNHRRELETIIEKIHIGVISLGLDGTILFLNDAARSLLMINSADPEAKLEDEPVKIQQVLDVTQIAAFEDRLQMGGDIIKPFFETQLMIDGKPSTPVMFAISQVTIGSNQRLLMTLVNIEKRKLAEQEVIKINESLEELVDSRTRALRETQSELLQQGKIAALGQMAATIVHELSQPLSAMNSSIAAAQLKAEKQDWDGALSSISRLAPLSLKMQNVIKLLKSFSHQDEQAVQSQPLAALIKQSLTLYKDSLREKNIEIKLQDMPQAVSVRVNPLKLDLVITNIIQNAIDAMEQCENPSISVGLTVAAEQALITIEDIGGGIDSRIMGQLFNPYFTTKDIGKGLGLGLSICHEIIQEYGGSIDAMNTEQGARFNIRLPLDRDNDC
jgi:two-component system, NtrC family, C4-dicarboxylate transport sensor histidine kinase DctB